MLNPNFKDPSPIALPWGLTYDLIALEGDKGLNDIELAPRRFKQLIN